MFVLLVDYKSTSCVNWLLAWFSLKISFLSLLTVAWQPACPCPTYAILEHRHRHKPSKSIKLFFWFFKRTACNPIKGIMHALKRSILPMFKRQNHGQSVCQFPIHIFGHFLFLCSVSSPWTLLGNCCRHLWCSQLSFMDESWSQFIAE